LILLEIGHRVVALQRDSLAILVYWFHLASEHRDGGKENDSHT
jgi:hypothetical protein